jgi:hypothetical protein
MDLSKSLLPYGISWTTFMVSTLTVQARSSRSITWPL